MPTENHTTARNERFTIRDLTGAVRSGKIRVPQFQRSFRWDAADVLGLFDSILRGYPFGSFLLWKRDAPATVLTIGAIEVNAPETNDALWVVDGQQRITSLVNAVDPEAAAADERFRILYSLQRECVVGPRDVGTDLAIPLPDLFDFGRALAWLADNAANDFAPQVQTVAGILNRVEVSAAVIEQADESVLRDIFDRINSRGRRLNAAEIFDAIHSSAGTERSDSLSLTSIAERVDHVTNFGTLDTKTVVQALLVRRHPDITRDVHTEFNRNRAADGAFPGEDETEAYQSTEQALLAAVRFLQSNARIPHLAFLPFRFQLLVLVRFFGFFPIPVPRNIELLRRWFWQSSIAAGHLGLTGSTGNVRSLAGLVVAGDESGSVQRLLAAVKTDELMIPNIDQFRTNHSGGKVALAALWSLRPVDPETGHELTQQDLADVLGDSTSPADIAIELFTSRKGESASHRAANRVIAVQGRHNFVDALSTTTDLDTMLLDESMLQALLDGRRDEFLAARSEKLNAALAHFLKVQTGVGLEATPPLSDLDLDSDDELWDNGWDTGAA